MQDQLFQQIKNNTLKKENLYSIYRENMDEINEKFRKLRVQTINYENEQRTISKNRAK